MRTTLGKRRAKVLLISMLVFLLASQLLVACTENKENKEYVNKDLGYAITLPSSIKDDVEINVNKNGTLSVETKFAGTLISVTNYAKEDYSDKEALNKYIKDEAPVKLIYLGETEKDFICYSFASDVQYDENDKEKAKKYNDMVQIIKDKGVGFKVVK